MYPIRLAILSDLHIGPGARASDLAPDGNSKGSDTDYVNSFLHFLHKQKPHVDFLVLPGDLTDGGTPSESVLAQSVISKILSALRIEPTQIIYSFGNHDVHWPVIRLDDNQEHQFWKSYRFAPLSTVGFGLCNTLPNFGLTQCSPNHYAILDHPSILAVSYNSAASDGPGDIVHHGKANHEDIIALRKALAKVDRSSKRLRLFLTHHHPIQYSDPVPNEPDFSIMINAEELLKFVREQNFDMLIHGHKHAPRLTLDCDTSGNPLGIFCAGSFSAELDTRWRGKVDNLFHIMTVDGRDPVRDCIQGHIHTWTYLTGHGWDESRPHNGLHHIEPFGPQFLDHELTQILQGLLSKTLQTNDYIEWKSICDIQPELKYLPNDTAMKRLRELETRLNVRVHGDVIDSVVILKGR